MTAFSGKDKSYASIAAVMFIMLLLATATGSAIALFGVIVMSAIALALMLVFGGRTQRREGVLIALMAAVIGIGVLLVLLKILPVELFK